MKDFTSLPAAYDQPRWPQLWHHGSQVVRFWHSGHFRTGRIALMIVPQGIHGMPPPPFPDSLFLVIAAPPLFTHAYPSCQGSCRLLG